MQVLMEQIEGEVDVLLELRILQWIYFTNQLLNEHLEQQLYFGVLEYLLVRQYHLQDTIS